MNTKLHAVTDTIGRPIRFFMTAGQVSDYTGARALVESLPAADWLLGDRGYDADWFREALVGKRMNRPLFAGERLAAFSFGFKVAWNISSASCGVTYPMALCRRLVLYQSTHFSVSRLC